MLGSLVCLAMNIYFEARNQPLDGQLMVAEVTINRTHDSRFPDTICEVVWEDKAFSWTHDGKSDTPKDKASFFESIKLSYEILNDESILLGTTATHYHTVDVKPYWASSLKLLGKVEDHIFYE